MKKNIVFSHMITTGPNPYANALLQVGMLIGGSPFTDHVRPPARYEVDTHWYNELCVDPRTPGFRCWASPMPVVAKRLAALVERYTDKNRTLRLCGWNIGVQRRYWHKLAVACPTLRIPNHTTDIRSVCDIEDLLPPLVDGRPCAATAEIRFVANKLGIPCDAKMSDANGLHESVVMAALVSEIYQKLMVEVLDPVDDKPMRKEAVVL
jgi:hypothetical protein